jgi:hypothetical protein
MSKKLLFLLPFLAGVCGLVAQTVTSANQGLVVSQNSGTGAVNLSWWGLAGRAYFIEYSSDMVNWNYLPVAEGGSNAVIEYGLASTDASFFLRLTYTDGLTGNPYSFDSDGDGIPDWWEYYNFGHLGVTQAQASSLVDPANGLNEWWEMKAFGRLGMTLAGTVGINDPANGLNEFWEIKNFGQLGIANSSPLIIVPFSGTNQTGPPGYFLPEPYVAEITNAAGVPLANTAVTFTVPVGDSMQLSTDDDGSQPLAQTLTVNTDTNGMAWVYMQMGNDSTTVIQSLTLMVGSEDNAGHMFAAMSSSKPISQPGLPAPTGNSNSYAPETDPTNMMAWPRQSWLTLPKLPQVSYAVLPLNSLQSTFNGVWGSSILGIDDYLGLAYFTGSSTVGYWWPGLTTPTQYQVSSSFLQGLGENGWWFGAYYDSGFGETHPPPVAWLSNGGWLAGETNQVQAARFSLGGGVGLVPLLAAGGWSEAVGGNRLGHIIVREIDLAEQTTGPFDNSGNYIGYTSTDVAAYTGTLWTGGSNAGTPLLGSGSVAIVTGPNGITTTTTTGQTLDPRFLNDQDMVAGYQIDTSDLVWQPQGAGVDAKTGVLVGSTWNQLGHNLPLFGLTSAVTTTISTGATVTLSTPTAYGLESLGGVPNLWWAGPATTGWQLAFLQAWYSPCNNGKGSLVTPTPPSNNTWRMNDRLEMILGDSRLIRNGTMFSLNQLVPAGWTVQDTVDINRDGVIVADATGPVGSNIPHGPVLLVPAALRVDTNGDGVINANDALPTAAKPFQHWLNDDHDGTGPNGAPTPDYLSTNVNGANDLKDFAPVVLDVKELLAALPLAKGYTYWLQQGDSAVNFVYTNLTTETAFSYQGGSLMTGFGPSFGQAASAASKEQITAAGVQLSTAFLNQIQNSNGDQGVILIEGRTPSNQPLVLSVWDANNNEVTEISMPMSLGARILLLLHGMNSNTSTWDAFVTATFGAPASGGCTDIRDGNFQGPTPIPILTASGVRCYRVQFGHYDMASTRTGLEGVSSADPGYNTVGIRCGDFETFTQLGQEVDDAIALLHQNPQFQNAQIVLLGHSRGGLSARAFLEGGSDNRASVIGLLTTSSPHQGSNLATIYNWLTLHPRNEIDPTTGSALLAPYPNPLDPAGPPLYLPIYYQDWATVDFMRESPWNGITHTTLDVRRPVLMDVASTSSSQSAALSALNAPAAVSQLPANIIYGEIIYDKADLGILNLGLTEYSVFDGLENLPNILPTLSAGGSSYILGTNTTQPSQFPGDGLVPAPNAAFTQLPGFPLPGYPPAPTPAPGQNTIMRLVDVTDLVVHTDAPARTGDLIHQLQLLAPTWFPSAP